MESKQLFKDRREKGKALGEIGVRKFLFIILFFKKKNLTYFRAKGKK